MTMRIGATQREKAEFVRRGTMNFAADTVIDSGFVTEWVEGAGVPTRSRHSVKGS